jgi:hypothetical protein
MRQKNCLCAPKIKKTRSYYNIGTSQKITNHKSATANKHKNEMWERSNIFCDLLPYGGRHGAPPPTPPHTTVSQHHVRQVYVV